MPEAPRPAGMTLVEMLVVIAIIGLLMALLLPAVQNARESGRRTRCGNNLRQIGVALQAYHAIQQELPSAAPGCCANPGHTWVTSVLPHIEESALYGRINKSLPLRDHPLDVVTTALPVLACPSDGQGPVFADRFARDNPATATGLWYLAAAGPLRPDWCVFCPPGSDPWCCVSANYGTLVGEGGTASTNPPVPVPGMFGRTRRTVSFDSVLDGLSNTLLLGETLPGDCSFISAFATNFNLGVTNIPLNTLETTVNPANPAPNSSTNWWRACGFKSAHGGVIGFTLADGSNRFIADTIDFQLINHLGTRRGGETVQVP